VVGEKAVAVVVAEAEDGRRQMGKILDVVPSI
jgi:hypothetical protein